jgi:hypothetical protein
MRDPSPNIVIINISNINMGGIFHRLNIHTPHKGRGCGRTACLRGDTYTSRRTLSVIVVAKKDAKNSLNFTVNDKVKIGILIILNIREQKKRVHKLDCKTELRKYTGDLGTLLSS